MIHVIRQVDTNIPEEYTVPFYSEEMSNTGKVDYIGEVKGNTFTSALKIEAV
jgi:hypothetical protein